MGGLYGLRLGLEGYLDRFCPMVGLGGVGKDGSGRSGFGEGSAGRGDAAYSKSRGFVEGEAIAFVP